jgi:hypothetical protein
LVSFVELYVVFLFQDYLKETVSMKNALIFRISVVFTIVCSLCYSATYNIPHNSISDHANASITGSIAWYFATYPTSGNVFNLTSNATYYISNDLTLPEGTTLKDAAGSAVIRAASGLDDWVMLFMRDNSSIYDVELNGDRYARHCICANSTTGIRIESCTLHKTKNNYTSSYSSVPQPHVIYIKDSTDAVIYKNLIRRAGCDPKLNPNEWTGKADLICASGNYNLTVKENDMAYALTAGVQMGNTAYAGVNDNIIQHTGLNWLYADDYPVSDGITAYHNINEGGGGPFTIRGNMIRYYKNHGIHVSGHNIKIESNDIYSGDHRAIYLGDYKTPLECSSEILIRWNYVTEGLAGWVTEPIYLRPYDPFTTSVYGNTGDNIVVYGSTCTP